MASIKKHIPITAAQFAISAREGSLQTGSEYLIDGEKIMLATSGFHFLDVTGGGVSGNSVARMVQRVFVESGVFVVPFDGTIRLRAMGAGASGARGARASGGGAAAWGEKVFEVAAGDTLAIVIGVGGASVTTASTNGNPGGDFVLYLNSTEIARAPGGKPGRWHATSAPGSGESDLPIGFDTGSPGGSSAACTAASSFTGGGAVALNFETFPVTNARGGVGTLTGPSGTTAGDGVPSLVDWGIVHGGSLFTRPDGAFKAGDADGAGAFGCGGGGASSNSNAGGRGGLGAGGGAALNGNSGPGGNAYAYLIFVAREDA